MSPKSDLESIENDGWFSDLFEGERPSFASDRHPSQEDFRNYLKGYLPGEDPQTIYDPTRRDWTMTSVSFHLLDCAPCQTQIAQLRHEELSRSREPQLSLWARLGEQLLQPRAIALHLKAFAAVAVVLLLINAALWTWSYFNNQPSGSDQNSALEHRPAGESAMNSGNIESRYENRIVSVTLASAAVAAGADSGLPRTQCFDKESQAAVSSELCANASARTKPEPLTPPVGPPSPPFWSVWWSIPTLLGWGALWLLHALAGSVKEHQQTLRRLLRPEPTPHRHRHPVDTYSGTPVHVSTWASFVR